MSIADVFEKLCRFVGGGGIRCVLVAVLGVLPGCHLGVPVPAGWERGGEAVTNKDEGGVLQVIVSYGYMYSNHTAMRLETRGEGVVFWDPGGTYREDDPSIGRRRDVILGEPPTLDRWWAYRRDDCHEPIMVVYEWGISDALAVSMRGLLLGGGGLDRPRGAFESDVGGWMCCKAVCDFLMRFDERPSVPKRWLLPLNLGKHLWTQGPDRVVIYRLEKGRSVWARGALEGGGVLGLASDD